MDEKGLIELLLKDARRMSSWQDIMQANLLMLDIITELKDRNEKLRKRVLAIESRERERPE